MFKLLAPPLTPVNFIAFIAGVGATLFLAQLPSLATLSLMLVTLSVLVMGLSANATKQTNTNHPTHKLPRYLVYLLWLILFAAVGFTYATWRAEHRLSQTLPAELIGQDITVEGTVQNIAAPRPRSTAFNFQIETLHHAQQTLTVDLAVRLRDYHRHQPPLKIIKNGARLKMVVRLRPPTSLFNPHGFDYVGYLFSRRIQLSGYVRQRDNAILLAEPTPNLRQIVRTNILNEEGIDQATLLALTIGDKQYLSDQQYDILRRTGTAHLVSISGTHIGFVFLLFYTAIVWLWCRRRALLLACPAPKAALLIALPFPLFYALLAGWTVPTQRSFYMLLIAALLLISGRKMSSFTILLIVMLGIVIIDPWSLIAAGFWLSFALTAIVIAVHLHYSQQSPALTKKLDYLKQLFIMQCYLSLLAMPLTLWFFNQASFTSPLANFFAVPWVGIIVLPCTFFGLLTNIWQPADWTLFVLWQYITFLSDWELSSWSPAAAPWPVFLLSVIGAAILLLPVGIPLRWIGILPVIALLSWRSPPIADGNIKITALDVGQGTSIVLQTAHTTQVYDTGPPVGGLVLRQYINSLGHATIDQLILSHNDHDHRGGADLFLQHYPNSPIMASDGDKQCQKGTSWDNDKVQFKILHPPKPQQLSQLQQQLDRELNTNDNSCVILITTANGKKILLTGDIGGDIEKQLIKNLGKVDILFVAHHGSRFSTSVEFLDALQPHIAIINVGKNRYGHPHPNVLQKLKQRGITIYRTDTAGAIVLNITDTIEVTTTRAQQLRYWH